MRFSALRTLAAMAIFALVRAQQEEAVVDASGEHVPAQPVDVPEPSQTVKQSTQTDVVGMQLKEMEAKNKDLADSLKLSKDGLDTCHREMSEVTLQLGTCEEARVAAKKEFQDAVAAEGSMRDNARAAQEENASHVKEIQSLKSLLESRNEEIVELKLRVAELTKTQTSLQQKASLNIKQSCERCVQQSYTTAKTGITSASKEAFTNLKAAISLAQHNIEHKVLPAVQEHTKPIYHQASQYYTEHAQPIVQPITNQVEQYYHEHGQPIVRKVEEYYKNNLAEQINERSKQATDLAQNVVTQISDGVAEHPLTEQALGRKVQSSEVSQAIQTLIIVLATFWGMLIGWKLLKAIGCILTWPLRKMGLFGNNARAKRQYRR